MCMERDCCFYSCFSNWLCSKGKGDRLIEEQVGVKGSPILKKKNCPTLELRDREDRYLQMDKNTKSCASNHMDKELDEPVLKDYNHGLITSPINSYVP